MDYLICFYVYNRFCSCNVLCMYNASKTAVLSLKFDHYILLYYKNHYTFIVLLLIYTLVYAFYIPLHENYFMRK